MSVHTSLYDYNEDDYTRNMLDDLQLAAELGKTLLERNKELENTLKQQQNVIEDQTQEIEYLSKQTVALREVNDSRLKIYEQLEVSIQDLERANHRLAVENAADKKHIKSLTANIEALELKCEQLQSSIDDLTLQVEVNKRRTPRTPIPVKDNSTVTVTPKNRNTSCEEIENRHNSSDSSSTAHSTNKQYVILTKTDKCQETQTTPKTQELEVIEPDAATEQISQLMLQLRETHTQCARDQRKITELEEQLETMQEQSKILEKQLSQYHMKEEDIKSVHEELNSLEEVRQGLLCSRCLRTVNGDDMSIISTCDDDDSSMFEAITDVSQHRTSFTMDVQEYTKSSTPSRQGNLYKDLVEKYEALLEVHRNPTRNHHKQNNCLSLQEELQMSGEFNNMHTDEESGQGDSLRTEKQTKKERKAFTRTPTDFSEAETSSSGFADETYNKATQTDGRPGSFLCTIADGEDKISIYDDASPIESRFRNRPEYRELFKEIFGVLKKAAKSKDENEDLPLLDDYLPEKNTPKVPPVTPSNDSFPDFPDNMTDDSQSVLSSTMSQSSATQQDTTVVEEDVVRQTQTEPPQPVEQAPVETKLQEQLLTPLVRQPLEFLSVSVNVRKRSSSHRKKHLLDRSDSPVTHIVGSPKVTYTNRQNSGRRRKEQRSDDNVWNGHTLQFWSSNRNVASPTPSQGSGKSCYKFEHAYEYKPSPASQDLHKLKKLELSYADVLRNSNKKWPDTRQRRRQN